jgi:hypothetical protein
MPTQSVASAAVVHGATLLSGTQRGNDNGAPVLSFSVQKKWSEEHGASSAVGKVKSAGSFESTVHGGAAGGTGIGGKGGGLGGGREGGGGSGAALGGKGGCDGGACGTGSAGGGVDGVGGDAGAISQ